jgi:molybdopterin converting factor small subunit
MKIRFHGPFESLAGKEARIELTNPIAVRELIALLAARYKGMAHYEEIKTDADLSAHLVFLGAGIPLKLSDIIRDDDTIEVLLPATGG